MRVALQIARTDSDVERCQALIGEVYGRQYEVVFSTERYDLDAKVDRWPHRYLMALAEGELVGTVGLYLHDTYVQRFGQFSPDDVLRLLREAGAADRYDASRLREITRLTVAPRFRGSRLSTFLFGCAQSAAFAQDHGDPPYLLAFCANEAVLNRALRPCGVRPRLIRPFPHYKVHERYRSDDNPMTSQLIIPDLDTPRRWYEMDLPGEYDPELMLDLPATRLPRSVG